MAPILSHSPSQDSYFHAPHLDTDLTTVLVVSTFMGFGLLLLMAAKLLFCDFAQNRRARKRVAVELSAGRVTNLEGGGGGGASPGAGPGAGARRRAARVPPARGLPKRRPSTSRVSRRATCSAGCAIC